MSQCTLGNGHVMRNLIRLINNDEAEGYSGREVLM